MLELALAATLVVPFLVLVVLAVRLAWGLSAPPPELGEEHAPLRLDQENDEERPSGPRLRAAPELPLPRPEDDDDESLEAFVNRVLTARAPLVRVPRPERVVFLHGFAGFSELGVGRVRSAYFRGVAARLRELGVEAVFVKVSPFAGIATRAREVRDAVRALGPGRVHLVAHSMGGLDARFALAHLGLAAYAESLVTVATPHGGTPIADLGAKLLAPRAFVERNFGSILDLTTAAMRTFERDTPDADGVRYASVVASPSGGALGVGPWLLPTYAFLKRIAGDNDGVVPVSSQARGEVLGHIDADHWGSVGWGRFDAPAFYEGLILHLMGRARLSSTGLLHRLPEASTAW